MSRRHALIIGNSDYKDEKLSRLVGPGVDVDDLSRILENPKIGAFDEVKVLDNQRSTTVLRAIAGFFAKKTRNDLLFMYFSGHGILDDQGRLYLALQDTDHDLPTGTGIPASFITDEMNRSRSQRQVLILDCCYSGAFTRGAKGALGLSVGTASVFEGTGYGRVVLTASDSTHYAWEGDHVVGEAEKSIFTQYLARGLITGEADLDADGRITIDELYDYVYAKVIGEKPQQKPGKWSYKQRGEIVVARNPRLMVKKGGLSRELQDALKSPFSSVREGAVHELEKLLQYDDPDLMSTAYEALKRLTDDDSRRVSTAARDTLKKYKASHPEIESLDKPGRQLDKDTDLTEKPLEKEEQTTQKVTAIPRENKPVSELQKEPEKQTSEPLKPKERAVVQPPGQVEKPSKAPEPPQPSHASVRRTVIAVVFFIVIVGGWFLYQYFASGARVEQPEPSTPITENLSAKATAAKEALLALKSEADEKEANTLAEETYQKGLSAEEKGNTAFSEGDYTAAEVAYSEALGHFRKAIEEARARDDIDQLKNGASSAKRDMQQSKNTAKNKNSETLASSLFQQAENKERQGTRNFNLGTRAGFIAAQEDFKQANVLYRRSIVQVEAEQLANLKRDTETARAKMEEAKHTIPGNESDRHENVAFQRALQMEAAAASQYQNGNYSRAQNSFKQAEERYLKAAEEIKATLQAEETSKKELAEIQSLQKELGNVKVNLNAEHQSLAEYQQATVAENHALAQLQGDVFQGAIQNYRQAISLYKAAIEKREQQREEILSVLRQYQQAVEDENLVSLKRLFVNLTRESENNWKQTFRNFNNIKVDINIQQITFIDKRQAEAAIAIRLVLNGTEHPNRWLMGFIEKDAGWLISDPNKNR